MPGRPDKGSPLRLLPYHTHRDISRYLDVSERWRKVIGVMPTGVYSTVEVERFAMAVHRPGGSPSSELLGDLSIRGFTVEQLVAYLRSLQYESPLLLLVPKDPVKIITHPTDVVCPAGGEIVLHVEAVGLPFPQYQWYKDKDVKIPYANDSMLRITNARATHSSVYCVYVHNEVNYAFSDWCRVQVITPQEPPLPMQPLTVTLQPPPRLRHGEGDIVKITCGAVGPHPLEYEWSVNDRMYPQLNNGPMLVINGAKVEDSGLYRCKVTSPYSPADAMYTGYCELTVEQRARPPPMTFVRQHEAAAATAVTAAPTMCMTADVRGTTVATLGSGPVQPLWQLGETGSLVPQPSEKLKGKVALVIGNQMYHCDTKVEKLYQAESDAAELASLLTSIDDDFRVVSLINLTGHEMRAAIHYFISLLGPGIYGVFYFAGHGFEYNGESYLLPTDIGVGSEPCIRAGDILYQMQGKGTKFSFLILDVCRTEQQIHESMVRPARPAPNIGTANYVVAHSCVPSQMAFERRSQENGIYMTHLKKCLSRDAKVEDVLHDVSKSINSDYPSSVQRPEFTTSTFEEINLHEAIHYSSVEEHKGFARLLDKWKLAHREPEAEPEPLYDSHGLRITLTFHAEFSNVLIVCIHKTVERKEDIQHLSIELELPCQEVEDLTVENLTEKAGGKGPLEKVTNLHLRPSLSAPWCFRICHIQKLQKKLCMKFKLRYDYSHKTSPSSWEKDIIREYPAPLVASLNLQSYECPESKLLHM